MSDMVEISRETADALSQIGLGDFNCYEQPERMAFVAEILKRLPDRPEWFPKGKWATLQSIEGQVHACADVDAERIALGDSS
jgi:hypothetical protein